MGASVTPHWPGLRVELPMTPGFSNDCKVWAEWLVEIVKDSKALDILDFLGAGSLTTFFTDGMDESEVAWVAPDDLSQAARKVSQMIAERSPQVEYLVELYMHTRYEIDDAHSALSTDLADVAKIADFVTLAGANRMTMSVNW